MIAAASVSLSIAASPLSRRATQGAQSNHTADVAPSELTDAIPGRRPDGELAGAWAALGQGWATLSQAEATRSIAAAGIAPGQTGASTNPCT